MRKQEILGLIIAIPVFTGLMIFNEVTKVKAQPIYAYTIRQINGDGPDVWLFEDNYVRCHIMPKNGVHCKDK